MNLRQPDEALITKVDLETDEPDASEESRPEWLMRGEAIGRYVVLECLGVGGMGVIYSAWDPKLDRKLAIKIVRDRQGKLGSTRGRARLLREGQALARLRHPNVVAVHDVGTHEGRVFVAMEFVEGQTVQQWLLGSPKPTVDELIAVYLQVGRGLAAAHRADLIHRDVKPENMMIGADGRVLVLDFGIAREGLSNDDEADERTELASADDDDESSLELSEDRAPLAQLTRAGAVVGTPAYMSPEQHRGLALDARSDQFAFCVAMWEALNGEKPYGEGGREKLLARMRTGQLRPFRNREVPQWIAKALRRGLSWSPHDRFPSMEALLEALNPRPQALSQMMWASLIVGVIVGLALGAVSALVLAQHPVRERDAKAEQPRSQSDPHIVELRRELVELERAHPAGDPSIARARHQLARALAALGDHEAALIEYERALMIHAQLASEMAEQ